VLGRPLVSVFSFLLYDGGLVYSFGLEAITDHL